MEEVWKSLKGLVMCGDFYEVSSLGKVRSIARVITDSIGRTKVKKGRELKPRVLKSGHLRVALCKDTMQKDFLVHRLVALAFIPNPENMPCINHKDECPSNNKKDNLEWCDRAYNNKCFSQAVVHIHYRRENHLCSCICDTSETPSVY